VSIIQSSITSKMLAVQMYQRLLTEAAECITSKMLAVQMYQRLLTEAAEYTLGAHSKS
jgi:hypothetical protein